LSEAIQYSDEQPNVSAKKVPEPTGYRLLIALPEVKEQTEGGIYVPDERRDAESVATIVGFVAKMGPEAYANKERFPSGPWCEEGDWIVMRAYSGTRIRVHGQEFRIINDDSVEAVIENPMGVVRA
jgi:co-chaperonin GroES (HSP10)